MTELTKIFLTSSLTIIGGCLVFVVQKLLLDPLTEQSKVFGKITHALHYYGREYGSVAMILSDKEYSPRHTTAADRFRDLGSSLAETSQGVRAYWFWTMLLMVPSRKNINEAIGLLTRISNSMFAPDAEAQTRNIRQNWADADEIKKLLRLRKWGK